jgi:hypothetical protein
MAELNIGAGLNEQASALASKAEDAMDSARRPVADTLHATADSIHRTSAGLQGDEKVASAAQNAADTLDSSASYLESHNTGQMLQGLMSIVKRHPAQALLIVGVLGFLFARALRRQ